MTSFFTSTLGDFYLMDEMRVGLIDKNDFLPNLRSVWREGAKGMFITAEPEDFLANDRMRDEFFRAFSDSGLPFDTLSVCDDRCTDLDMISGLDVIILGGGHVPTQNKFFEKIGLFERIKEFGGLLLSLSAGSMNCAKEVYSIPELEGEAKDPDYKRFFRGLGLTECNMLPHFQYFKDVYLDGLHVVRELAVPDSMGRKIYALPDGSYIMNRDGKEYIYGEAHLIHNGEIEQISKEGDVFEIS